MHAPFFLTGRAGEVMQGADNEEDASRKGLTRSSESGVLMSNPLDTCSYTAFGV